MSPLMYKAVMLPYVLLSLLAVSGSVLADGKCINENTAIPFSTPSSDFTVHGDGTVTHNPTGLMWMQCSLGQSWDDNSCTGSPITLNWQNALQAAEGHSFGGYSDWRLPNKNELASILELRCWHPSINGAIFPNMQWGWFWSSSPHAYYSNYAWYVHFGSGAVGHNFKYNGCHVLLVRAGQ